MGENEFFLDDGDAKGFCIPLVEVCECCGWKVHAYVLMSNHFTYSWKLSLRRAFEFLTRVEVGWHSGEAWRNRLNNG